jgi:hypothetical protein
LILGTEASKSARRRSLRNFGGGPWRAWIALRQRQKPQYVLHERGRRLAVRQTHPLHFAEPLGNPVVGVGCAINDHRNQKRAVRGHKVGAIHSELPFEPKVALGARVRIAGNQRNEQRAILDLPADGIIPGISTAQFTAVEPHFDAGGAQGGANPLGRARVLRGIAQKYGARAALGGGISGLRIDVVQWIVCRRSYYATARRMDYVAVRRNRSRDLVSQLDRRRKSQWVDTQVEKWSQLCSVLRSCEQ